MPSTQPTPSSPVFLLCGVMVPVVALAQPPVYRLVEVASPNGARTEPTALSDTGYVCGDVELAEHGPLGHVAFQAFVWREGEFRYLGTLGGQQSGARSLNGLGQVVGWAERVNGRHTAALWLPEAAYGLPAGTNDFGLNDTWAEATQITEEGRIVLRRSRDPYLWLPSAYGDFPAGLSRLHDFGPSECHQEPTVPVWNERGELAGACLWLPEGAYGFSAGWHPMPAGVCSQWCGSVEFPQFWRFSNNGVLLVGWSIRYLLEGPNLLSAFDLNTRESWTVEVGQWVSPWGLNDAETMVGQTELRVRVAGVWQVLELAGRCLTRSRLHLDEAIDINNHGWIVARCCGPRGYQGCLLIPISVDFNGDGATELQDYLSSLACLTGPGIEPTAECARFDVDQDGSVDIGDHQAFQLAFDVCP